jgi:peptide/nickel transport system permease protein
VTEQPVSLPINQMPARRAEGIYVAAARSVLHNRLGRLGVLIIVLFIVMALGAPVIAPYDPIEQHREDNLHRPSLTYLLGTDELGRDLLSRIIHGSRIAFTVGLLAVSLASVFGAFSGMVAGYVGGMVDSLIMRFWDMIMAFPPILLAVGVVAVLGSGHYQAAVALAVINFPRFARLARGNILAEKEKDYVMAARSIGVGHVRIIFRHLLPNILAPLMVQSAIAMAWAVLLEASLSFLGLGTQPPYPSWGSMLQASRRALRFAPWYAFFPGAAIALLLLGLNLLADALRDALDPTRVRLT